MEYSQVFKQRETWVLCVIIFTVGLAVGSMIASRQGDKSAPVSSSHTQAMSEGASIKAPSTVTLEGTGRKATNEIDLQSGKVTVTSVNKGGDGNFSVYLVDSSGEEIALLANELGGESTSSKIVSIETPGKYAFNVSSEGDWIITVQQ